MEAADGVVEEIRVVSERGGDPRMRKLEQGGSASAEEDGGFAIDRPGEGGGTEEAASRIAGKVRQMGEQSFAVGGEDVLVVRRQRHDGC